MATIAAATRYWRVGVSKFHFLPTVAATTLIPTRAEITAGTDITPEVADVSGFGVKGSTIKTPDASTSFTPVIAGRVEPEESMITLYANKGGTEVRTLFPRGQAGYIYIMDGGDVPTKNSRMFPVVVSSISEPIDLGDTAAVIVVTFAITRTPNEAVAIPT